MFDDRKSLETSPAHAVALDCLEAGIRGADPETATASAVTADDTQLRIGDQSLDPDEFDRVLVLGGGKAAAGVVRALEAEFGDVLVDGLVVVPADSPDAGTQIGSVEVAPGGHPVPSAEGTAATRRMLDLAQTANERTLVLAVVTGGGSALLAAPPRELTVEDLQQVTRKLLDAGADITAINAVRKHLSAVKGGRLAAACAPATVVGLVVSDVVGDSLPVIASGPTAPDDTTYADALAVLERYGIDAPAVRTHLERGVAEEYPETPGPDDPCFEGVRNHIVASNRTAIDAAATAAAEHGFAPCVLSTRVQGDAAAAAPTHVAIAREVAASGDPLDPPAVLLSGGETTVDISDTDDPGVGGPNLEFALAAALELRGTGSPGPVIAAVDTDGRDGSTVAAGALVDADTVDTLEAAQNALAHHDSLPYLTERDTVLRTGPTGTNVDDLRVVVVPDS
ncbi:glycerate kinase [Halolamina sp.]|uniref:glycerate kinase type-2 family protein n=1 Tax=Halolamina sp. TaxID=1940283 RepID=UPI003566AF44